MAAVGRTRLAPMGATARGESATPATRRARRPAPGTALAPVGRTDRAPSIRRVPVRPAAVRPGRYRPVAPGVAIRTPRAATATGARAPVAGPPVRVGRFAAVEPASPAGTTASSAAATPLATPAPARTTIVARLASSGTAARLVARPCAATSCVRTGDVPVRWARAWRSLFDRTPVKPAQISAASLIFAVRRTRLDAWAKRFERSSFR